MTTGRYDRDVGYQAGPFSVPGHHSHSSLDHSGDSSTRPIGGLHWLQRGSNPAVWPLSRQAASLPKGCQHEQMSHRPIQNAEVLSSQLCSRAMRAHRHRSSKWQQQLCSSRDSVGNLLAAAAVPLRRPSAVTSVRSRSVSNATFNSTSAIILQQHQRDVCTPAARLANHTATPHYSFLC